jgi:hypothetical protein
MHEGITNVIIAENVNNMMTMASSISSQGDNVTVTTISTSNPPVPTVSPSTKYFNSLGEVAPTASLVDG